MNAGMPSATTTNIPSNDPQFPLTVFATVWGLRFGSTTNEQPVFRPDFGRVSGLLLVQLAPGEFGLILAGRFYNMTLLATRIAPDWRIIADNDLLELRWSPHTEQARTSNMWLHLRFNDRVVFADFNRRFWGCYWEATEHSRVLQQRLDWVAHAAPSNFTRYCRQYLGDDYFDNLPESEDESEGEADEGEGENGYEGEGEGEDDEYEGEGDEEDQDNEGDSVDE